MLIYAQRPDATACTSMELWNDKMSCLVNRGAKGIALIDDTREGKLKYVFDVSDVHAVRQGRYPNLWKMKEEHKNPVIKKLEALSSSIAFSILSRCGYDSEYIMDML